MRDIKFRGYSKKYESWFYGYLVPNAKGNIQIKHILDNGNTAMTTVETSTIGQYTGLKDKNGKEMYEGDIVNLYDWGEIATCEVIYDRGCFCLDYSEDYHPLLNEENHCCEVIGNIYDNPNLIKE